MAPFHFPRDKGSWTSKAILSALCQHAQTMFPALQRVKFYGRSKSPSCKGSHRSQCGSQIHMGAGDLTIHVPGLRGALSTACMCSADWGQRGKPSPNCVTSLGLLFFTRRGWTRFYEECISSGKLWPSANHLPGSTEENCSAEFSSSWLFLGSAFPARVPHRSPLGECEVMEKRLYFLWTICPCSILTVTCLKLI